MSALAAGFADPVHDAQRAFRAVLAALARPGRRAALPAGAGLPLPPALAQCLLALADEDTAVWWDGHAQARTEWLRFHTGAPRAALPAAARFAAIEHAHAMPALAAFEPGSAQFPERSATLLIELPSFDAGPALEWRGPGIRDVHAVAVAGLPADFWSQWQANHAAFPQGVDVIFTCNEQLIGLPRSTRVRRLERL
jgi:alpha-D-ribose 1-methylphosphonate 5-triphosphate synthase subunit PhnH